jgi:hypothetical protein
MFTLINPCICPIPVPGQIWMLRKYILHEGVQNESDGSPRSLQPMINLGTWGGYLGKE